MANPTDNILSQITGGTDILGKFENAISNLSSVIEKLTKGVSGNSGAFNTLSNNAKKATSAISETAKASTEAAKASAFFGESVGKVVKGVFEAVDANKSLAKVGVNTMLTFQMLSEGTTGAGIALTDYAKVSEEANKTNLRFADSMSKVLSLQGEMGKAQAAAYQGFVKSVNEVKSYENAIMSAAQTGGNFFSVYADGGEAMVQQNENVMNKVAQQSADTGNMLGIHYEDAHKLIMQTMGSLPGEFGKVYEDIVINSEKHAMTTEQVLGRVTRGIGISTKEGIDIARELLYKFGEDAVESAERMSVLSVASKNLGMQFSDMKGFADELDSSFKMWGNQLDSMVPILTDVSKALEGTNVGIKGQIELVKNLGNAAQTMSLPMKGFVGIMSGMRSGGGTVGVGLNIERMLQEGKSGEVVGMIQQSMQKMTGRGAVSLNEATDDPRSQQAFMVQRQMLGTMTGISDTGQLNRLLEVMSKSELGTAGSIDAQNALTDAMETGDDIISKQTDVMATVAENTMALQKTLVATNTLYSEYINSVTAQGKGTSIMKMDPIEQAMNRRADAAEKGIDFNKESMTGEAVQTLMAASAAEIIKTFATSFTEQGGLVGSLVQETTGELGTILKDSTNPEVAALGKGLKALNEKLGDFGGSLFETVKENIDYSSSASGMPDVVMDKEQKERIEIDPVKIQLDLTIKDGDGNAITNEIYDIVSAVQKNNRRN